MSPIFYLFIPSLQVVTEYERAVIFRLGRLRKGGAKGPGIVIVIPCIDTYRCVDLRTVSFDVPPQEASILHEVFIIIVALITNVKYLYL